MHLLFINDTETTEIYTYRHTISLHDALPIFLPRRGPIELRVHIVEDAGARAADIANMFDDIGALEGAILQCADRPSRMHREAHQTAERKARRHDHAAMQIVFAVARDCGVDGPAERAITVRRGSLDQRSEEHTSELPSLMTISAAVFCLTNKK